MEITVDGRRMGFGQVGVGQPVVLLHAFPFDGRFWEGIARRLQDRARIITPDLRGFGGSDLGPGGWTIADLADDVAALLDSLGHDRAVVGGLSMGGYVAMAFADRHPTRLAGLILADTKAAPDSNEARAARAEAIDLVKSAGVPAYVDKQLPKLLAASAGDDLRAQVPVLAQQTPDAVIAGLQALRDRPDRRADLFRVACPALVVVGGADDITPPADARSMSASLPRGYLIELPGAGHLSNLEMPDTFAAAVEAFIAGVKPA